jgi:TPR repeat protein
VMEVQDVDVDDAKEESLNAAIELIKLGHADEAKKMLELLDGTVAKWRLLAYLASDQTHWSTLILYARAANLVSSGGNLADAARKFFEGLPRDDGKALYTLGWISFEFDKDYAKAKDFYEAGVALGNPSCMNSLGKMLDQGLVVEKDSDRANKLFEAAGELGNFLGLANRAVNLKAEKKDAEAEALNLRSARLGNPHAMSKLAATAFLRGDLQEETFWLDMALEFELALFCKPCYGIMLHRLANKRNDKELLRLAAENGNPGSQMEMSKACALNGDDENAEMWRRRAIENGYNETSWCAIQ